MIVSDIDVLHIKSEEVTEDEGNEIAKRLIDEVEGNEIAAGLAAIQIAIPKRVFITLAEDKQWVSWINPVLEEKMDEEVFCNESCLSLPGQHYRTKRSSQIKVSCLEENERRSYVLFGLDAIIFQHELDHLNGIILTDHGTLIEKEIEKVGRNELCPCGSGKKFKKCHGK